MSVRLFVGGIDYDASDREIRSALNSRGIDSESISYIARDSIGRCRGFAFIDAESLEAAQQALDGLEIRGRLLSVAPARPRVRDEDRAA
jgi:RNA recognition motif-containing protein